MLAGKGINSAGEEILELVMDLWSKKRIFNAASSFN